MATQGSRGNRKRTSAVQQLHYKVYRTGNIRLKNMIKRLQTRISRNAAEIKRKAARTPPRIVELDTGAINRLKSILN